MGARSLIQIRNSEGSLIATLFANSSHTTQFAETVFTSMIKDDDTRTGPNALVEKLLTQRYETAEGNHSARDRIFWLVPGEEAEQGDWEVLIEATHCGVGEELLAKGYASFGGPAWSLKRQEFTAEEDSVAPNDMSLEEAEEPATNSAPQLFAEILKKLDGRYVVAANLYPAPPYPQPILPDQLYRLELCGSSFFVHRGPADHLTFNEEQASTAEFNGDRLTMEDAQGFMFDLDLLPEPK